MAITKGAKKALRQSKRRKVFNGRRARAMRDAIKGVKRDATKEGVRAAYQAIDKAMKRGLIKKNTAARKKAQMAKLLKA